MFKTTAIVTLLIAVATGLILVGVLRYGFPYSIWENPESSLKKLESDLGPFFPQNTEDEELRLEISEAYCEVLRVSGKVTIEGFSECADQYSGRPLEIYKAMTKKTINASWNDLTKKEKEIVVQEVLSAKVSTINTIQTNQQLKAWEEQWQRELEDIKNQSPSYDGFFKQFSE